MNHILMTALVGGALLLTHGGTPAAEAVPSSKGQVASHVARSAAPSFDAANRKGSKRVGGTNKKGKKAKYVGGRGKH